MQSRFLVPAFILTAFGLSSFLTVPAVAANDGKSNAGAERDLPAGAIARFGSTRLQHGRDVTKLIFSRDGQRLFAAGGDFAVRVWDVKTGREVRSYYNYACQMRDAALSPDEELLTMVTHNIGVLVRRTGNGDIYQRILDGPAGARTVAFAPDGRTLFIGGRFGLKWWDIETKEERDGLDPAKQPLHRIAILPDGRYLIGVGGQFLQLWDWKTGKTARVLTADNKRVRFGAVAVSRDGRFVAATSGSGGKTMVWDLEAKKDTPLISLAKADGDQRLFCAAFSADGEMLFTGGSELTAWDWRTGKVRFELAGHQGGVNVLAVSPDGKLLASGGKLFKNTKDFTVRLWDLKLRKEIVHHPHVARSALTGLAVAADGRRIVATGSDHHATVWDTKTQQPLCRIHRPDAFAELRAAFSPDGKHFAMDAETQVTLWDAATGQAAMHLKAGKERKRCVSFSPDGKYLAAGGRNGGIYIWDVQRQALVHEFRADNNDIWSVEYSPDGETLLVANVDGAARLWSAATGKLLLERKDHAWMLRDTAMSPLGMRVAGVSDDHVIAVWEVATGELVHKFKTDWSMGGVAFCGRGRVVVVGRTDDWLDFWDLATGERFHRQKNRPGVGYAALVPSPDWRTLYTAGSDSTVLQWDLAPILAKLPKLEPAPTADALVKLWTQLETRNPAVANRTIWQLAAGGDKTVEFLNAKLAPPKAEDVKPETVKKLIRELDANQFIVREKAFNQLAKIGRAALPLLEKSLKETKSLEVRFRLRTLISRARGAGSATGWNSQQLQAARARQVLTYLDTPAARKLLDRIQSSRAD